METGQPSATVEYGNDIDSSQFGSGFPVCADATRIEPITLACGQPHCLLLMQRGYARKGDVLDSIGLKETSDRLGVIDRGDMTSDEYYKCSGWNLQNIAVTPVDKCSCCVPVALGCVLMFLREIGISASVSNGADHWHQQPVAVLWHDVHIILLAY